MKAESVGHSGRAILLALPWVLVPSSDPTPSVQGILLGLAIAGVLTVLQRASFRTMGQVIGYVVIQLVCCIIFVWQPVLAAVAALGFTSANWVLHAQTPIQPARLIAGGLLLGGVANAGAGWMQFMGLAETSSVLISVSQIDIYGYLRQRNHYASLMSMALLALFWRYRYPASEGGVLAVVVCCVSAVVLGMGGALSLSRTGLLQLVMLAVLSWFWWPSVQQVRLMTAIAIIAYVLTAVAFPWAVEKSGGAMVGIWTRFQVGEETCTSRLTLWRNMAQLIAQRPLLGAGWGELDYVHFMTSYDGSRFCELLSNAHNLPLHLAVELGLPAAVLICGAAAWLVWRARPWQETDPARQLAWGVLALIALHSMLEYPLWYGPFQMAVGLCIGLLWRRAPASSKLTASANGTLLLRACSVSLLLGVAYAAWDYRRVSQIYLPPEQRAAAYRDDTLRKIQDSWLFRDQVRFAELSLTPLTSQNAQHLNTLAHQLLHFSPEARVVEMLIESALLLGRDEEARAFMQRYQAAYPQAYAQWVSARRP